MHRMRAAFEYCIREEYHAADNPTWLLKLDLKLTLLGHDVSKGAN